MNHAIPLTDEQLGRLCQHYRLPRPSDVQPISTGWLHTNLALTFKPEDATPPLLLRIVKTETGRDTLHRELVGLVLARGRGLPIVDRYHILPDGMLSGRAVLSTLLPGRPLSKLHTHPGFGALCTQVGQLVGTLSAIELPHFGTSPNRQNFLPAAGSWRREWEGIASGWLALARRTGECSSLLDDLEAALRDRLGALDEVSRFHLVHGDLHSGNLLAQPGRDGQLAITGLIDWDQALAGDHLIDWATLLNAPSQALAAIARGYGTERVAAMRDPGSIARLEAYTLTNIIMRIGVTAFPPFQPSAIRALSLTLAAHHGREALTPGGLRARIEEALAGTGSRTEPRPALVPLLARRTLHHIVSGPPLRSDQAADLQLALSATLLAHRTSGPLREAYATLGHGTLDGLGLAPVRYQVTSGITRAQVEQRVFESVLSRPDAGMSVAIALLSGVIEVVKSAEIEEPHGLWSAMSALLEGILYIEERSPVSGLGRLAHTLMGLEAAITVGAPAAVISKYGTPLLDFPGVESGSRSGEAEQFIQQGPPQGVPQNAKGKALMPLVLAMARLEEGGRLSAPATSILTQLGFLGR